MVDGIWLIGGDESAEEVLNWLSGTKLMESPWREQLRRMFKDAFKLFQEAGPLHTIQSTMVAGYVTS